MRSLIYNETESQSKLLDPFYTSENLNSYEKWPPLDELLKQESNTGENANYTERVTEELGKDYTAQPALFMLILVESLVSVSRHT